MAAITALCKSSSLQNVNKESEEELPHVVYYLDTLFDPLRVLQFRHLD